MILNRAAEAWNPVVPPKDHFALIADLADQGRSIERATRALEVSAANFFAWRQRPPSERAIRHAWLTDVIREVMPNRSKPMALDASMPSSPPPLCTSRH